MRTFIYFLVLAIVSATCLGSCKSRPALEQSLPEANRFRRIVLAQEAQGLNGATEFDIAADGKIYLVDLSGHLRIFDPVTTKLKTAGQFDGGEFGLIGVKLDPDFEKNSFIYLQYFRAEAANKKGVRGRRIMQVSRFTLVRDSIDSLSEKNYLQIPYEDACCHTGGGMDFDTNRNLYIATGDNIDAFFTQYSPVVDIPGHDVITDGLRSAGNTNDDRGKILRIHPEADGSFSIPAGNLFPAGMAGTKPEIYIMGVRNPYRITVDRKSGFLFWGEVGPDAARDSSSGPRGYDEFNQARQAGNFGWPLVIGNNQPYPHVYYNENNRIGELADTLHPLNNSVNNTGLKRLPPTQPAMIWYPYDSSRLFPSFGAGGRTAIGGPFYQYDSSLHSAIKFPAYFDHCWFIADWMRNWIKLVHFTADNRVSSIEDFLPDTLFRKPICMKFGPDGALYVLEFGSTWGENPDGKLVKIEYQDGNRAPVAALDLDKAFGKTPLTVHFSANRSIDYDHDRLRYEWKDGRGKLLGTGRDIILDFKKPGQYKITLTVRDALGASSISDTVVAAGNAKPIIHFAVKNQSFYWDTLHYSVEVYDEEDGATGQGIGPEAVSVSLRDVAAPFGYNAARGLTHSRGEVLLNESDCMSCHQPDRQSAGPSFADIATRYAQQEKAIPRLAAKILKGGSGHWGTNVMSAHPQLNMEQAMQIVEYVYSLKPAAPTLTSLPVAGTIRFPKNKAAAGSYHVLQAIYTDKGAAAAASLSAKASLALRSPTIHAADFEQLYEGIVTDKKFSGRHGSGIAINNIDITGIREVLLRASGNGSIDLHLDSANGPLAGRAIFKYHHTEETLALPIQVPPGFHSLYFTFNSADERFSEIYLRWVRFVQ